MWLIKLLRLPVRWTIDNEFKFKKHINELCKKASYKLHALQRIKRYLSVDKARLLAPAFIDSQFNYTPLIWMFAGKVLITGLNKLRVRSQLGSLGHAKPLRRAKLLRRAQFLGRAHFALCKRKNH